MTGSFARPVLHVSNVEASLRFYVDGNQLFVPYGEHGRRHASFVQWPIQ
jgi:hypothetical protein